MERRIREDEPVGILAYAGGEPVAWCSIAPVGTFQRLGKAVDKEREGVWSLTCFFVPRRLRGQGLSRRLLQAAIDHARARGADTLEAYPVEPDSPSYGFLGRVPMFLAAGFEEVGRLGDAAARHAAPARVGFAGCARPSTPSSSPSTARPRWRRSTACSSGPTRGSGSGWRAAARTRRRRSRPRSARPARRRASRAHCTPSSRRRASPVTSFAARKDWPDDLYVIPEYHYAVEADAPEARLSAEHTACEWLPYNAAFARLQLAKQPDRAPGARRAPVAKRPRVGLIRSPEQVRGGARG